MKIILDEGMPLRAAALLRDAGVDTHHVLELKMCGASDEAILKRADTDGAVVATFDSDFHQILATTGASHPSVIRVRIEGLSAGALAEVILTALKKTRQELCSGAAVSVEHQRIRLRKLPIK